MKVVFAKSMVSLANYGEKLHAIFYKYSLWNPKCNEFDYLMPVKAATEKLFSRLEGCADKHQLF